MREYWDKLDVVDANLIKFLLTKQQEYVKYIEDILDSERVVTQKTMQRKLTRAKQIQKQISQDIKNKLSDEYVKTYEETVKALYKQENFKGNFNQVSWSRIKKIQTAGLSFLDNYTEDMYKKVKNELNIAYMNGESFYEAFERIKPIGNNKSRPKIMIRDQMSRISQTAIEEGYKSDPKADEYEYYWTGPDDSRTTDICEDRKAQNPYTFKQMKKLDPHPHIQCRHRWTRKLKRRK